MRRWLPACPLILAIWLAGSIGQAAVAPRQFASLRQAIVDLTATFGPSYPQGQKFLARLEALEQASRAGQGGADGLFEDLRREALLANPLLDFEHLLVVKRKPGPRQLLEQRQFERRFFHQLGLPSNHECNSSLPRTGYDNEIAIFSPRNPKKQLRTLYRCQEGGYVGEMDVHWDARRLLFTRSDAVNWKLWEINTDGTDLRQLSALPEDVDSFDGCYLPGGQIIFGSTAAMQSVPCWHGQKKVSNLYRMNADGSGVRQLCFDQDHNFHPTVLQSGQVVYHRWDYVGINHIFLRQLMVMNPDGTGQRALYGSNSWFPNSLYFPRPLPGKGEKLVCILSGYHGVHRMGQLVAIDPSRGTQEAAGVVQRISGRGDPVRPLIRDNLVDDDWPMFLHPWPLSDKFFLVACCPRPQANWGIYLVDIFDNVVLLREEPGYALLEPVPLQKRQRPPVLAERSDPTRLDAEVYLHDVYAGPGLQGVPRGTVKSLRVLAYHFGYLGMAGPDKIGYGGPWEVMRILGTVPVQADGSALFRVPANTPLALQPLDAQGSAVQLMRSWFTARPGEKISCVGCHERSAQTASPNFSLATRAPARKLTPWYGPARGFSFAREVQPVLDQHCLTCHHGPQGVKPDLRPAHLVPDYQGKLVSKMEIERMHPRMRQETKGMLKYTPAYEALLPYIRRVGIEDDVSLLLPGEFHTGTSELIQLLRQGHHGVKLDAEAWDRLVTWIDLNGPCHGTWGEVYPIPDEAHQRRLELRRLYGGPRDDPEVVPKVSRPANNGHRQGVPGPQRGQPREKDGTRAALKSPVRKRLPPMTVDLGNGIAMKLEYLPSGSFVMGDAAGEADEQPPRQMTLGFWMGACEVTNEQYRQFDPGHDCRYYSKRHAQSDDQGLPLNGARQPAVRVSWEQAMAFCRWLSARTGKHFTLPTETEWEYACRAGTTTPLYFGELEADFSRWANVGDRSFSRGLQAGGKQVTGGLEHLFLEGAALCDTRFDDRAVVTAPVGSYQPNPWGLFDMHGNAAEWTQTAYGPQAGVKERVAGEHKVVRGGSFFDRPGRCRSSLRYAYPAWQRLFNVGFRVVCSADPAEGGKP